MDRRQFFKAAGLAAVAVAADAISLSPGRSGWMYAATQANGTTYHQIKQMKHKCKITVLKRECYRDLQARYLADPKSGPCPFFHEGQEIMVDSDNYFRMLHGTFCAEAWDCISRYVYAALQGGSIMRGWTNDEKVMITCCNDGTRPVVFKLERIDEEE